MTEEKSFNTINSLVIVIILALTLTAFGATTASFMKGKGTDEACLNSIRQAAAQKAILLPGKAMGDPGIPVHCPRQEREIKKKEVVNGNRIDQDAAHKIIADEMVRCWKKIGQGELDPFSDWEDVEDKSLCMICTRVHFDENLQDFMEEGIQKVQRGAASISDSLITTPLPYLIDEKAPKMNLTYFEFLFGAKPTTPLGRADRERLSKVVIDDNSLIMVRMYKFEERDWLGIIVGGTIAVVGVVVGVVAAPFTLGSSLAITAVSIGAVGAVVGGIIAGTSAYNAFGDCPECEGEGSIQFVPSTMNLYEKNIEYIDADGNKEEKALCDILVN